MLLAKWLCENGSFFNEIQFDSDVKDACNEIISEELCIFRCKNENICDYYSSLLTFFSTLKPSNCKAKYFAFEVKDVFERGIYSAQSALIYSHLKLFSFLRLKEIIVVCEISRNYFTSSNLDSPFTISHSYLILYENEQFIEF